MEEAETIREMMESMRRFRKLNHSAMHMYLHVSQGEFFVLGLLYSFRNKGHAASVSSMADQLEMSMPAVSRILRSLEEKDYIIRSTDRADRRNTFVEMTSRGEKEFAQAFRQVHDYWEGVMKRLGYADTAAFLYLMNRLLEAMQKQLETCEQM
ncbi:MarR family winged helix-turn-helix transcriptional regulator [Anaerolentibacter hominis]|uniref:MarR family winged helix-turn-helix transcriptional regulator n=1 Tax=Anaerolentibacter hominis TaxID=3079009 RepID=UPI0031B8497F